MSVKYYSFINLKIYCAKILKLFGSDILILCTSECSVKKKEEKDYCICACISCTFLTRIYSPKLGCGLYTELLLNWVL
jgi:hypothetical protein